MKTLQIAPRKFAFEFDRRKLKRVISGIILAEVLIFAFFYYHLRDPLRWMQQYLPGIAGAPRYLYSIYAPFDDGLQKPMAVVVSGRNIYISDTGNSRIAVFDYNGNFLYSFGEQGTKPGQLRFPYGIAADSQGRILVADMYNGNISAFSSQGTFLHYFGSSVDLVSPAGLAVNEGRVYVSDVALHKVLVFDEEGERIFEFGGQGTAPGQFLSPNAITVNKTYIAVSDTGNHRIQVFNKLGTLVREISQSEPGRNFVNPRGVGFSQRGELFVVNNMTHQMFSFNPDGQLQHVLGRQGHGNGEFFLPNGLFIDDQGRVYVTDTSNRRVNVYF